MRFLVDRSAGRRLSEWLRGQGHDLILVGLGCDVFDPVEVVREDVADVGNKKGE